MDIHDWTSRRALAPANARIGAADAEAYHPGSGISKERHADSCQDHGTTNTGRYQNATPAERTCNAIMDAGRGGKGAGHAYG